MIKYLSLQLSLVYVMLKTLIGNSLADGSRLVHVNNQGRAELHLGQIIRCHKLELPVEIFRL
jgi:hypothetical protein